MIPLMTASRDEVQIIKRVSGRDEIKKHLANMGFIPGAEITVLNNLDGDLIINVKDARVAINRELAEKIFV